MDNLDPEKAHQTGQLALRDLLDAQLANAQELLDDDSAFGLASLSYTRERLRISVQALYDLGVEALAP